MPLSLREINHLNALTSPRGCPAKIRSLSPKQSRNSESNAILLSSSLLQDYRELRGAYAIEAKAGTGNRDSKRKWPQPGGWGHAGTSLGLWSITTLGPSILTGSPINLGSAFASQSLFLFRARIFSGPSFLGCSPVIGPLPLVTHCVSPLVVENQPGWCRLSPVADAR